MNNPPKKWPNFYPEGCPPSTATPRKVDPAFRCAEFPPPNARDFIPHFLKFEDKDWGNVLFDACAVSCYTDINGARNLAKKLKKFKYIVKGTIPEDSGVVEIGRKSHLNWWVYDGYPDYKLFKKEEEVNKNE